MEFHYQLTADDVQQALRDMYAASSGRRLARLAAFAAGGVVLGTLVGGATHGRAPIADILSLGWLELLFSVVAVVFVLSLLSYFLYIPRMAQKLYQQTKSMQLRKELRAEERGLRVRDDFSDHLVLWDHIHKWRETTGQFVVYLSDYVFFIIPKHSLDGASRVDRLRTMLTHRALQS